MYCSSVPVYRASHASATRRYSRSHEDGYKGVMVLLTSFRSRKRLCSFFFVSSPFLCPLNQTALSQASQSMSDGPLRSILYQGMKKAPAFTQMLLSSLFFRVQQILPCTAQGAGISTVLISSNRIPTRLPMFLSRPASSSQYIFSLEMA